MNKDKIIKILEYYLPEESEYLYYESHMYPHWVKRNYLINHIANDILTNEKKSESGVLKHE